MFDPPNDDVVCPVCEAGELHPQDAPGVARCAACDLILSSEIIETLWQIRALPDAQGGHACECGHPEMRRLPGGVFHCPACRSEVGSPASTYKPEPRAT